MNLDQDDIVSSKQQQLQLLKQSWINEKSTPDILPYRKDLIDYIMNEIQTKEEVISSDIQNPAMQFTANIYEMEIERLKYLIKSYLRTRLQKVEKYHSYILKFENVKQKLSENELQYCQKYSSIVDKHFNQSFLQFIPDYSKMESNSYQTPFVNGFIFCTPAEEIGLVQIEDDSIEFQKGEIYLIKYSSIGGLVESGKMNLI